MTVTDVTKSVLAIESLTDTASADELLSLGDHTARPHRLGERDELLTWTNGIPSGGAGFRAGAGLPGVDPSQPVRGRDAELAVLREHLDQLLSGAGTVALIEGGDGMGKSRLLREVATMARCLSIRVGMGEASLGDRVVQLSALMDALLDGSWPILGRAGLLDAQASTDQRYWLRELEGWLKRAAREMPVLVCLDNLQWADSATAAALRALPTRLAAVRVAWVLAYRPDQGSPEIRSATDHLKRNGAETIVLGPLDEARVAQLAADVPAGGTRQRAAEDGRTRWRQPVPACRALLRPA